MRSGGSRGPRSGRTAGAQRPLTDGGEAVPTRGGRRSLALLPFPAAVPSQFGHAPLVQPPRSADALRVRSVRHRGGPGHAQPPQDAVFDGLQLLPVLVPRAGPWLRAARQQQELQAGDGDGPHVPQHRADGGGGGAGGRSCKTSCAKAPRAALIDAARRMNGAEQPRVYISGTLPALHPPPRPGPMDDTAAAAGHRRALRGDGTRNNRRFGRTRRGAAGWETLSGRTAGRRAEVSWAARGAERWARGDGDVCATNAPRPPSRPRPLPAPSPSPPRPPPVRSAGRAARSATRANMSGRSRSEPRLRSGTPRMGLRLMTPQPGFAACRCPGPVLTEVTALGVCIIPGTASGADGSGPAVPTRSCAAAVRDRGGEPTEGPTVGLHGAFPSSRTDQTRRGQRRAEPTVTPSAEVEVGSRLWGRWDSPPHCPTVWVGGM